MSDLREILYACYLWVGPSPAALRYVIYFRFVDDDVKFFFTLLALWRVMCIPKRPEDSVEAETVGLIATKLRSTLKTGEYSSCVAQGG